MTNSRGLFHGGLTTLGGTRSVTVDGKIKKVKEDENSVEEKKEGIFCSGE